MRKKIMVMLSFILMMACMSAMCLVSFAEETTEQLYSSALNRIEAENSEYVTVSTGAKDINNSGAASGSSTWMGFAADGETANVHVNVPGAGKYYMIVGYSHHSTREATKTASVSVNNVQSSIVVEFLQGKTGTSWEYYRSLTCIIDLAAGDNQVTLTVAGGNQNEMMLDFFDFKQIGLNALRLQAEDDNSITFEGTGASGGGGVGFVDDANAPNASDKRVFMGMAATDSTMTFTINAPKQISTLLSIRYSHHYTCDSNKTAELSINDGEAIGLEFIPGTATNVNWETYLTEAKLVTLNKGDNTVTIKVTGGEQSEMMLDYVEFTTYDSKIEMENNTNNILSAGKLINHGGYSVYYMDAIADTYVVNVYAPKTECYTFTLAHLAHSLEAHRGNLEVKVNDNETTSTLETTTSGTNIAGFLLGQSSVNLNLVEGLNTIALTNTIDKYNMLDWYQINIAKYEVTFNVSGDTGLAESITVESGSTFGTLPTITKNGYAFKEWNTLADGSGAKIESTTIVELTANVTLYAIYDIDTYTITYNLDGGTNGANPSFYTIESEIITLKNPIKVGYTFIKWTEGNTISEQSTGNKTFTATYSVNNYNVIYDANDGTGAMESMDCVYGTEFDLTENAFVREGYMFDGWNTSENGTGTAYANKESLINMTTNSNVTITLYAQWKAVEVIPPVEDEGCGGVVLGGQNIIYFTLFIAAIFLLPIVKKKKKS